MAASCTSVATCFTCGSFGDNVEDRMGHVKFLVFYLLCRYLASLTHVVFDQNSMIPSLGASGAIAGVLGAYLVSIHQRVGYVCL